MSDIVTGQLGPEASYDVAFASGALQVSVKYTGAQASLVLTGSISAAQLIGALAEKVTNPVEKELLAGLQVIIQAIP